MGSIDGQSNIRVSDIQLVKANGARGYRPEIDGLRAIAVSLVLLHHYGFKPKGGFIGVDIFFVISGYLITSILQRDLDRGRLSLVSFWERRVRRLWPALTVMMLAIIVAGYWLLLPGDYTDLSSSAIATTALSANWLFYHKLDYFAPTSTTAPLLHMWSLAVEEQFYLIYPLLLMALTRYIPKHRLKVLVLLFLMSFVYSEALVHRDIGAAFFLLPSRAWELLLGGIVAQIGTAQARKVPPIVLEGAAIAGLVCLITAARRFNVDMFFPGIAAAVPCFATGAIIWATSAESTVAARLLSLRPLVQLGKISYALYLVHWPLIAFRSSIDTRPASVQLRIALLLVSLVLAMAITRFIETPIRSSKVLASRHKLFGVAFAYLVVAVIGFATIIHSKGFGSRFDPQVVVLERDAYDGSLAKFQTSLEDAVRGRFYETGRLRGSKHVDVVVWGDSHALSLYPGIREACHHLNLQSEICAHSLLPPVLNLNVELHNRGETNAPEYNKGVWRYIDSSRPALVILAAHWEVYPLAANKQAWRIKETIQKLNQAGVSVILAVDVPGFPNSVPRYLALRANKHQSLEESGAFSASNLADLEGQKLLFDTMSGPRCTVFDPRLPLMRKGGGYSLEAAGRALYVDGDHVSFHGAAALTGSLEGAIKQALTRK